MLTPPPTAGHIQGLADAGAGLAGAMQYDALSCQAGRTALGL